MPAYTILTAAKQANINVDFSSADTITAAIDSWMVFNVFGNGATTDVNLVVQFPNDFPSPEEYSLSYLLGNGLVNVFNVTKQDFSSNPQNVIRVFAERFFWNFNFDANDYNLFAADAPSAPGDYNLGNPSNTYVQDLTAYLAAGYSLTIPVCPFIGHGNGDDVIGGIWWSGLSANNDFYCNITGNTGANGTFAAFETPGLTSAQEPDYTAAWHDDTYNYFFCALFDGVNGGQFFLTRWQPGNIYDNFNIELSDPTDDAIFQQLIYSYAGTSGFYTSPDGPIFYFQDNFPIATAIAFVFNKDMSEYTRYDITSNSTLGEAVFFIDSQGTQWLSGYDNATFNFLTQFIAGAAPQPAQISRNAIPIALPCQFPCVPLMRQVKKRRI